ncbi:MAG: PAS domain S-box protein [Planctomycetota bacterium]
MPRMNLTGQFDNTTHRYPWLLGGGLWACVLAATAIAADPAAPNTHAHPPLDHHLIMIAGLLVGLGISIGYNVFCKRRHRRDVARTERRFLEMLESTTDWAWEVDADGRYTYASGHVKQMLGYEPAEVLGKRPKDLMDAEDAEHIWPIFAECVKKKQPFIHLQNVNLHKDGRRVILEANGIPIFDHKGSFTGYRGIDRDVTERVESERQKEHQQKQLDTLFRASPAGIGLVRNRQLVRGNKRFFEITGYPEDELIGMDPRQMYQSLQDYLNVGEKYTEAIAIGSARIETRFIRKDRTVIDVVVYIAPLDKENVDAGFVVVIQDITALKAARRQVVAEKTRAQMYLDVAEVMIVVLDADGKVQLINKKGCEILECTPEQALGADWFQTFLPESYRAIMRSTLNRIISGDAKLVEYFENPVYTTSGIEKLIAWHNAVVRDPSGRIIGAISSGEDITEARAVEKALRESSEQLRVALSAAQMGAWRWQTAVDQDTRDANLNAILGLPAEETTQSKEDFFKFVHPDDQQVARDECNRAIREQDSCRLRFRINRPDGAVRWVLDQGKPFYDNNGQLEYMTGVVVDITGQKEAEQKLQESETALRKAQRIAKMGNYELDLKSGVITVSDEIRHIFAFMPDEEVNLEKVIERTLPEDRVLITQSIQRAVDTGSTEQDFRFWMPDGQTHWLYTQGEILTDPNGEAISLFGVARDITERKLAEQRLRFTQFAVDHTGEAAYWTDSDARFVYVNEAACRSLGYTREELLTMSVFDFNPVFSKADWPQHWQELKREGSLRLQSSHRRKDGTVFPVDIAANFVGYEGVEYNCAFVQDITERKAAEQNREMLMQRLRDRNDELQSIVYTTAHDLRSPLVNIDGFAGELEKGLEKLEGALAGQPLSKEAAETLEYLLKTDIAESLGFIQSGSRNMDALLKGLMRLSTVGAASIKLSAVNMNDVFDSIIEGLQYQINENIVDISVRPDLPACIGDFTMLTQVFGNLLDNAIKYYHPERSAVVKIDASIQDDIVEYTVADNGIGIDPVHSEKVFELFHRLNLRQQQVGQGLGLTIVRRILSRLSGSARIESAPNKGTTVYVRLPKA